MVNRSAVLVVLVALGSLPHPWTAFAQTPTFEVASVRANNSGESGRMLVQPGGRFTAEGVSLSQLLVRAYGVQDTQITGAPGWMNSARFDITAKAASNPTSEQLSSMLRNLLRDRFRLAVHQDSKESTTHAVVLARSDGKLGPQLKRVNVDCDAIAAEAIALRGGAPPPVKAGEFPPCSLVPVGGSHIVARSKPIESLVNLIAQLTRQPVIDRTGLTGVYDIDLTWALDQDTDSTGPSLETALQEQLGLKLVTIKSASEVLVIDHIERPSEN